MLLLLLRLLLDDCRVGLRLDEARRPAVHVLGPDERQLLLPLQLVDPLLVSPQQHSVKAEMLRDPRGMNFVLEFGVVFCCRPRSAVSKRRSPFCDPASRYPPRGEVSESLVTKP